MIAEKLRNIYTQTGADALFIETDYLRRYLTDFYSTDGYVILTATECLFVCDLRYYEAAARALGNSGITVVEGSYREALEIASAYPVLGVPFPETSITALEKLKEAGHTVVDAMPALRAAMLIKTDEELARIQRACEIAENAFNSILSEIKEGMEEREVAALLEYRMRQFGASGTSFETICAFGENASVPHYETGSRPLKFGDPILIDFGCKFEGYCSDITRTFLFGDDKKHEEFKKIHACVLEAHERAKENIAAGMTGREADAIARGVLRGYGLDGYFTHSLGHGIGLLIHEFPVLSPRGEEVLCDGMVFSDEPGVYIAGKVGVRIEDSVHLKDGKVVSFMKKASRNCLIL